MDFIQQTNRNKVYESMKNLDDKEDAILLHIDILTEGIDLPSITGVLLLRHLNEIKLFQALGRALRLFKADRKRLYSGEITSKDRSSFVKPYAYLILPMHFEEMDESSEEMLQTLQRVVGNYGIPTEEFLPPEEFDGITYEYLDPVTHHSAIEGKSKLYPLTHAVLDLAIKRMSNTLPLTPQEKYKAILELIKQIGE
jgi:superfamily II DNA or RNA helicase